MPSRPGPIAIVLAAVSIALALFASAARGLPPAGTGDAWVDATLADIDRYAARYPDAFDDELVRYHGAPRTLVAQLRGSGDWRAGDIYFACALAQAAGQPCRRVVAQRDAGAGLDWNAIARGFGITAGSRGFQQIKRALVHSYERWARPLQVDASLHAEFPGHALAPAASHATRPATSKPPTSKPPTSEPSAAKPASPGRGAAKPDASASPPPEDTRHRAGAASTPGTA
jgi:hypothetical protein